VNQDPGEMVVLSKVINFVGLAHRAGKVSIGADRCFPAIRGRSAALVFLAADAGANTAKKVRDKSAFYHIPLCQRLDRNQLGQACGHSQVVVMTVNDTGFATKLKEYLAEINWEV